MYENTDRTKETRKRFLRPLSFFLAALLLCMAGFPMVVAAQDNEDRYYDRHDNTESNYALNYNMDGLPMLVEMLAALLGSGAVGTPRSFTPDGAGTIIDNLVNPTGMEFLSVMATDGSMFYIVIDRNREYGNVYLLRAVASADLAPIAYDANDIQAVDNRQDITNEELLEAMVELLASGIFVHLQGQGVPQAPQQGIGDINEVVGSEDSEGGTNMALLIAVLFICAGLAALAIYGIPKLGALLGTRKSSGSIEEDDEECEDSSNDDSEVPCWVVNDEDGDNNEDCEDEDRDESDEGNEEEDCVETASSRAAGL